MKVQFKHLELTFLFYFALLSLVPVSTFLFEMFLAKVMFRIGRNLVQDAKKGIKKVKARYSFSSRFLIISISLNIN